ncbi:multicopper oxidase domain-containing protein [Natrialba aegyptia]|uniref:multicopper oxidase domain-containing protein n=1 Tax=Natrialba aegyptia TaxID=129789 RepID=UPI0009FEF7AB|nr:multicopper oxidase domain-containing protein [Natrialba aegyptia]
MPDSLSNTRPFDPRRSCSSRRSSNRTRIPAGRLTFDFLAGDPGDWLFHCHTVYHLERGTARAFEYE